MSSILAMKPHPQHGPLQPLNSYSAPAQHLNVEAPDVLCALAVSQ